MLEDSETPLQKQPAILCAVITPKQALPATVLVDSTPTRMRPHRLRSAATLRVLPHLPPSQAQVIRQEHSLIRAHLGKAVGLHLAKQFRTPPKVRYLLEQRMFVHLVWTVLPESRAVTHHLSFIPMGPDGLLFRQEHEWERVRSLRSSEHPIKADKERWTMADIPARKMVRILNPFLRCIFLLESPAKPARSQRAAPGSLPLQENPPSILHIPERPELCGNGRRSNKIERRRFRFRQVSAAAKRKRFARPLTPQNHAFLVLTADMSCEVRAPHWAVQ